MGYIRKNMGEFIDENIYKYGKVDSSYFNLNYETEYKLEPLKVD